METKKQEHTLTLKEAIEHGYTHFCYGHPSNGYQTLDTLDGVTQQDIDEGTLYLADKETFSPSGISHEELKDMIADYIAVNHSDNTGDDTDIVFDTIKQIDFSDVVERIDNALSKLNSYRWITEIRLV